MDSTTLLYISVFFFILGAGIIGLIWVLVALVRSVSRRGTKDVSNDPNLSLLARLLRDLTTQELVVEVDGKTFKSASELSAAQQHRLGIISSVLVKWLQPSAPADVPVSIDLPQSTEPTIPTEQPAFVMEPEPILQPETTVPSIIDGQDSPAASASVVDQSIIPPSQAEQPVSDWIPAEAVAIAALDHHTPPFTQEPEPELKPVSTNITDVVSGILNPTPAPVPAFKSIAMQINDILQEKITDTGFESRGISVSDGPDHGVLVSLDGKKYSGVKEVPDEEVRSLLRSVVMDWEKHNKPASK